MGLADAELTGESDNGIKASAAARVELRRLTQRRWPATLSPMIDEARGHVEQRTWSHLMSHLTRCLVWLFAASSLLATPAMAATLQCADQDELSSCTAPAIWASFRAVYRDGSEGRIDSYLSQTEQRDLKARLRSGHAPTAAAEHWEEKFPRPLQSSGSCLLASSVRQPRLTPRAFWTWKTTARPC